ncbi:hypothetical protein [Deinococcus hopiensis]|uniref:Uncharacterized protein n=1 Tax=Deinococcus hopiensis KR-140 TaxID=695939 RepID=A0A1W1V9J5_9DEIO|nr:hypothetical protein [Deinococcus hopiensis]SMB89711.1 hypothetical protein SAMN00790413_00521 [Deinococcus hopiensis KR-140]
MAEVPRLPVPPEDFALPCGEGLRADLEWLGPLLPGGRPTPLALWERLLAHHVLFRRPPVAGGRPPATGGPSSCATPARTGQRSELSPDVLGFYFFRLVLGDLAVDVTMLLRGNTRPEEDEANLRVLERFVLPALQNVEAELQTVGASLR